MQSSRRSFLKTSGLAALLGVVGTAGCLETVDDAVGGGPPDYANWLYDPAEVYAADYVGFGTFDVQSVYENEDELPEGMMDQVEAANEEADFLDLEAMENVTGLAYGDPNQGLGGGSMVVSGEFEVDAIRAEIENEAPEEYETTTHDDFTLYTMTRERPGADEGPDTNSATIAVSGEHVLVGGMQAAEVTSADAVTTMIDAGNGDVPPLHEENEEADELVAQLGDATLVMGGTFDADLTNFTDEATPDEVVDAVDDLVAVGVASDVDGDTVEHTMAFVYATEEDASADDVKDAIDRIEETNEPAEEQLEDRSVSRDGRTVLASTTGDTEALFEPFGLFGAGPTGTATASGSASERQSESVPQVRFDFQYRDDGKVEITHRSGDHVDTALHVRYEHDGGGMTETWSSADGIMAGDEYVTQRAPDPGSKLLLVWVDGDRSAVLGSFVVPE